METQLKVFQDQLKMANETDMPIVIHCREMVDEVYDQLKQVIEYYIYSSISFFFI